jgi:hypothetical protein
MRTVSVMQMRSRLSALLAVPMSRIGIHAVSSEEARKLLEGSVLRHTDPLGPVADDDREARK